MSGPRAWWRGLDGRVRPLWRALLFFVVAGLATAASGMVTSLVVGWFVPGARVALAEEGHPRVALLLPIYGVTTAVLLLCSGIFLRWLDHCSWRTLGLWFHDRWTHELVGGAVAGTALMLAADGGLVLTGRIVYHGVADHAGGPFMSALAVTLFLFFPAATEELLFRGYLFQRLVDAIGAALATSILGLFFAIAHLGNPAATPLSAANTALVSVLMSVAYLKTKGLWLPIGLHWSWNAVMGALLSLPVSGRRAADPLFHVEISGPAWLTGGHYGPEGGIVVTIVCTAAIAALWYAPLLTPSQAMQKVLSGGVAP